MKNCIPGCEFMLNGYCNLHETDLQYVDMSRSGKISYIRCRLCEEEKEELEMVEDLDKLDEVLKNYEDKGFPITSEVDKRRRLFRDVESR